jgi:hypothetical protein
MLDKPEDFIERAVAMEKKQKWKEAATLWQMAVGASIGHNRRSRYQERADHCLRQLSGKKD